MTPPIHGLVVSVGYSGMLLQCGQVWLRGLASLMVVTSPEDAPTRSAVSLLNQTPAGRGKINLYLTDAFTRDGAAFNKGLAMEEARSVMPWEDWILFFDADIIPPLDWYERLGELQLGYLYGALRYTLDHGVITVVPDDRIGYGYFQLFHAKDPKVQRRPLLDICWRHAGNYDSNFLLSFGSLVKQVPFPVFHKGLQHQNWFGIGKEEAFAQMQATRNGLGIHESERLP